MHGLAAIKTIVVALPLALTPWLQAGATPSGEPGPAPVSIRDATVAPSGLELQLLAGTCFACHGPDGQPPAGAAERLPRLRGRPAAELLQRLRALRAGQVDGASVMPLLLQGYDDGQLRALAQWFAEPPLPPGAGAGH
ncbi:hypothetical protein SAMN05428957_11318 [Oryzisolibacter propanilivorax]|uniref:Cytochrome c domain-containing protein n=1 Tax=Oryzisolibacter propanilivorax TaxID=1527607 RepID=A0A1G9VIV6_9BURK|nr:cytochrome C [Oryzisolibacter propanilivorax]SDM72036.1 hypothetical protein SAMN05428957_11318 [Oryzisolibacter propanilivorax]